MAAIEIRTTAKVTPQCYAYTLPDVPANAGWTKIGFTEREVETRIKEQTHTAGLVPKLWWHLRAAFMTEPYGNFKDTDFHAYLKKLGVARREGTEWFEIAPDAAKGDYIEFAQNHGVVADADADAAAVIPYRLREEQEAAVTQALAYFHAHAHGEFLWNCKPRFGKTLSAYDLCHRMQARNVLIVTNRPAIANSWYQDYETFFGPQSGYLFVSNVDGIRDRRYVVSREAFLERAAEDEEGVRGCIEFVSLQDLKGSLYFGGTHEKLAEVSAEHGLTWDLLIIDEAHEGVDTYKTDTAFLHINRRYTLHLSGTPFKALANDKFPEKAIYNWTYADEQRKKRDWDDASEQENPYAKLPRLSLFTYQMSEMVRERAAQGITLADQEQEEYAFDLNEFFAVNESGKFVHDADVDKFLDALTHQEKFPFSTPELRAELKHTFWLLNRVASAKALAKKLRLHPVFKDYEIVLAAGDGRLDDEDETEKSFDRVTQAIRQHERTITLSVGQLTTGVTIPEWTAVLMLSNMASPALYMQAAFRAQNPCLFVDAAGNSYRKQNAYVFDFDPARTLTIFEQFANDLIPETSGEKGDFDQRRNHVRELLNFFPVYGEDDAGVMIELDAESVLTIPRHIHAKEVVERGFMSNFLFANISGIFGAPREIIDIINGLQAIEEPSGLAAVDIDEDTADALCLNDEGEVEVPEAQVIGTAAEIFGKKVYADVSDQLTDAVADVQADHERHPDPRKEDLESLKKQLSQPLAGTLMETARQAYGKDLRKSTQNRLERKIQDTTDKVVSSEYADHVIRDNQLVHERDKKIAAAQQAGASMQVVSDIDAAYGEKREESYQRMVANIQQRLGSEETVKEAAEQIVETVETEKLEREKDSIEGNVRDHLRGFSRTIPAFLMAYGDEDTTLENFDALVPAEVFWEVTVNPQSGQGVTLDTFRMLRDGGDYYEKDERGREIRDEAHKRHFDGHLFDPVVFDDAVQEFMRKRRELANYFSPDTKGDIFDYIPPQKTNQIFTPKRVVRDMVDRLERENPGCFDNPEATFADLYMKSGMYVTEIVRRLYQSPRLKALYPDERVRLNHIFSRQVYGCAPTEIIYRICLRYILGFSEEIEIEKHHIRLFDTLPAAKEGTLEEALGQLFCFADEEA